MEYELYVTDELYHHGIKGQRWGIRRFQNRDGSLTKAGQRRRAKLEAELKQLKPKRGRPSNSTKTPEPAPQPRKKTVNEMNDDELRAATNRVLLESAYYTAQRNLAAANPKKVSAGEKFMKGLVNDVVAPAAKNAGREWLEKFMKDKLGLNNKSPLERLKNEYDMLDYQKKIKGLKKDIKDIDSDPVAKLKKEHDILDYQKKIENLKKGEPDITEVIARLNNLSDDEYNTLVRAANVKFYEEGVRGKGVKPDKGKDKKKDDDDD